MIVTPRTTPAAATDTGPAAGTPAPTDPVFAALLAALAGLATPLQVGTPTPVPAEDGTPAKDGAPAVGLAAGLQHPALQGIPATGTPGQAVAEGAAVPAAASAIGATPAPAVPLTATPPAGAVASSTTTAAAADPAALPVAEPAGVPATAAPADGPARVPAQELHPTHPEHPLHPEHPEHPVHPEHPEHPVLQAPSDPVAGTPAPTAADQPAVTATAPTAPATAPAAPTAPAPQQPVAPEHAVATRHVPAAVVEAARKLHGDGAGRSSLVVRLDPPELGSVVVRLTVQEGRVDVVLRTPDADTSNQLRAQGRDVLDVLASHGLDLGSFDVSAHDSRDQQQQSSPERATARHLPDADVTATVTDDVTAPRPAGTWL